MLLLLLVQQIETLRENYETLLKQERALIQKQAEARTRAHELLDAGRFEEAVQQAKNALSLAEEVKGVRTKIVDQRGGLVKACLPRLGSENVEERDRATKILGDLGPTIFPLLAKALTDARDPEVRARLVHLLGDATLGADGLLHQWAAAARASSRFGDPQWSAAQAVGPPNAVAGQDHRDAWASKETDAGEEWLELDYRLAVRVRQIRIRATYNPGCVTKVEGFTAEGKAVTLWQGSDEGEEWLKIDLGEPSALVARLRITLDTSLVPGWNEIDAVELVGKMEGSSK